MGQAGGLGPGTGADDAGLAAGLAHARAAGAQIWRLQVHRATVLAAGTGPFGDLYPGQNRLGPALFDRTLFCETTRHGQLTASRSCPSVRFDGWAHHTYPLGPPTRHARNANDVVVPDMRKLTQIMAAARRAGLVKAAAASNVWITEMSWDSFPDPNGLTLDQQAKYMEGAFYVLWKSGVKHILWWNSRDDAQGSDWNATLQSGIFLRGADPSLDTPKPSYTAYHFPFTAYRSQGVASLWAFPPAAGPVTVQALTGAGTWTTVATLTPKGGGVDTGSLRVGQGTSLRAVQGGEISLTWTT